MGDNTITNQMAEATRKNGEPHIIEYGLLLGFFDNVPRIKLAFFQFLMSNCVTLCSDIGPFLSHERLSLS